MKIGVISDSHDNLHNLNEAIDYFRNLEIETVLHLGDFCAPTTIMHMLEYSKNIKFICVWGNVDGDKARTMMVINNPNFDIVPENFRSVEIDNKKVFLSHYPEMAQIAAKSNQYDASFYGHNHLKSKEYVNVCLLANPGEIVGYKTRTASLGVWETQDNSFEHIDIQNSIIAV